VRHDSPVVLLHDFRSHPAHSSISQTTADGTLYRVVTLVSIMSTEQTQSQLIK